MGNEFGRNIKDFRKIHGIKQEVLANEIGCSVGYISNVESGKRIPSLQTVTFRGQQGRISRPVKAILSGRL